MGQDPRDIERRIEDTRERMGDTVEALTAKADVPGRLKGYVADKKDAVASRVADTRDSVAGVVGSASETGGEMTDQAGRAARKGAGVARENPLGLAIGSVAAGFLIGMLLPGTRVEDEKLGPVADDVKEQVREAGSEAVEHGKQIAQDAAQAATETARRSGHEHGAELREGIGDPVHQSAGDMR